MYDNSELPLTELEKEILELRSTERDEEKVVAMSKLVKRADVSKQKYIQKS